MDREFDVDFGKNKESGEYNKLSTNLYRSI